MNSSGILIFLSIVIRTCIAADAPQPAEQLKEIGKAHDHTIERVRDLQEYKPSPEELAANAIRVEKHVTMSEKTGKIKMVSYKIFRGDRKIKYYLERDQNDHGECNFFMEVFLVDGEDCASLIRKTAGAIGGVGSSVSVGGVPHVQAMFSDKNSDGKYDELLLMKDDGQFIDYFRRDADGLLQPVGAAEYLQAKRGAEAVAPIMGATLGIIDSGKKEEKMEIPHAGEPKQPPPTPR